MPQLFGPETYSCGELQRKNYQLCIFGFKNRLLVKANLFRALPVYSSHCCHSSFTHTDHLHTVLTVLSCLHSISRRCQVFSAVPHPVHFFLFFLFDIFCALDTGFSLMPWVWMWVVVSGYLANLVKGGWVDHPYL